MAVTVTEIAEGDETFIEKRVNKRHTAAHSFGVDPEGRLHLFDALPESVSDSREKSTVRHTVAIYAPGRWVKAVRS